jgi:NADH-quinone oxidoreductase subunit J
MLLDLKAESMRRIKIYGVLAGIVAVGAILAIFLKSLGATMFNTDPHPAMEGGTHELGMMLFKNYVLPFEVVSVLLLVAMIGVILLSKKNLE